MELWRSCRYDSDSRGEALAKEAEVADPHVSSSCAHYIAVVHVWNSYIDSDCMAHRDVVLCLWLYTTINPSSTISHVEIRCPQSAIVICEGNAKRAW